MVCVSKGVARTVVSPYNDSHIAKWFLYQRGHLGLWYHHILVLLLYHHAMFVYQRGHLGLLYHHILVITKGTSRTVVSPYTSNDSHAAKWFVYPNRASRTVVTPYNDSHIPKWFVYQRASKTVVSAYANNDSHAAQWFVYPMGQYNESHSKMVCVSKLASRTVGSPYASNDSHTAKLFEYQFWQLWLWYHPTMTVI